MHHARVGALLHDPGDDVALLAAELSQHGVVGDVAQALADDLLRGEGGDPAEVLGVLSSSPMTAPSSSSTGMKTATWPVLRSSTERAPSGNSPVGDVCPAYAVRIACSMMRTSSSNGLSFSRSTVRSSPRSMSTVASVFSSTGASTRAGTLQRCPDASAA